MTAEQHAANAVLEAPDQRTQGKECARTRGAIETRSKTGYSYRPACDRTYIQIALARSCHAECASAPFLEQNGVLFTLTLKPRKLGAVGTPGAAPHKGHMRPLAAAGRGAAAARAHRAAPPVCCE